MLLVNNYIRKKGAKNKGFAYEIVSYKEYEKLKNAISTVLDDILNHLKTIIPNDNKVDSKNEKNLSKTPKMNSSEVVHSQNEPLNEKETNEVNSKVQKFKKRTQGQKKIMNEEL